MTQKIQNFFLSCRECILENPHNFYGSFSLGPFKNSQSLTVANALRRTLLAEISGVAITHIEIEGVAHEYSTLVGVRESVLDLLLNFKSIVLKNTSPLKKPVFGYLSVRGPGIVRVSDLKLPPTIKCVDPDQYIATLNENGMLHLKFRISDYENAQKTTEHSDAHTYALYKGTHRTTARKLASSNLEARSRNAPHRSTASVQVPRKHSTLKITKWENFQNFHFKNFQKSNSETKFGQFKKFQKKFSNFGIAAFGPNKNNSAIDWDKKQQQKNLSLLQVQQELESFSLQQKSTSVFTTASKTTSLWVDPVFNPILKVNYVIETIEPIQNNIPNQIIFIELWTNGSIHPRKAFYEALLYLKTMFDKLDCMRFLNYSFTNGALESEKTNTKFLKSFEYDFQFYNFLNQNKKSSLTPVVAKTLFLPEEIKDVEKDYVFDLLNKSNETWNSVPIAKLKFPYRIAKILEKNNFVVVADLLKITPNQLKKYPGIGYYCISIIQERLEKFGLKLNSIS